MSHDSKYKWIYFALMLVGVAALGALSPWLKSFGSTTYVAASLVYLVALVFAASQVTKLLASRFPGGQ